MRKLILAITVLMMLGNNVNADTPTDKGVYSLSGVIAYSRLNGGGGSMLSVTPGFMYFVYPNLAIGASLMYWEYKNNDSDSNSATKSYGIGPAVRYYFGKEAIYPFASVEYFYTKDKDEANFAGLTTTGKGRGNRLSLGLGIDYFLAKNVALEPMVRYTFSHSDHQSSAFGNTSSRSDRSEGFFMGMGINVFIY